MTISTWTTVRISAGSSTGPWTLPRQCLGSPHTHRQVGLRGPGEPETWNSLWKLVEASLEITTMLSGPALLHAECGACVLSFGDPLPHPPPLSRGPHCLAWLAHETAHKTRQNLSLTLQNPLETHGFQETLWPTLDLPVRRPKDCCLFRHTAPCGQAFPPEPRPLTRHDTCGRHVSPREAVELEGKG